MQDASTLEEEPSPADVSPELTKHFRGLRMWLPMKVHGLAPFRNALQEKLLLAQYFYEEIQKIDGFEVYQAPELSVVMFRFANCDDKNLFNKLLIEHIHADGRIFLSSTTVDNEIWLRAAVLVFRTHLENVNLTLSVISEFSNKLCHSESLPS
jgi:glutamate/tyrosine decarboxylase-like PLP-dependent enzyme